MLRLFAASSFNCIKKRFSTMVNPIIELSEGKLKGKVCETDNNIKFYGFKGIPYAKPPIGELRFSAPSPPDAWEGVMDATKDCNRCAQLDKETNSVVGDEDCLYLNVYTPKLPSEKSEKLPVMFFIHGGGFLFGCGTDDSDHGADYLVEKDVVVVTINYRLGIFGFLSLDHKDAQGNMGLKDMVMALKWVQKNITNFNGDPKNVTIFGVSAGGAAVEYLVLSPMAKGLFHKAVAHSGSSLNQWAQNTQVKELAPKFALLKGKSITDSEELLKLLKSLTTKDLVATTILLLATMKTKGGLNFGFVPTVENPGDWEPFLDRNSYEILSKGDFTKVPFISGYCAREGLLMVSHVANVLDDFTKNKQFIDYLPFKLDDEEAQDLETRLKNIYLEQELKYPDDFAINYFGDVDFIGGIYVASTLISKNNTPTYFYEFAFDGDFNYLKKKHNIDREDAAHGDDMGYFIKSQCLTNKPSEKTKLVQKRVTEMWTNFAKYGDPTPKLNDVITTKWESITENGLSYLHIDEEFTMKTNPLPKRMKLFEELYQKHPISKH